MSREELSPPSPPFDSIAGAEQWRCSVAPGLLPADKSLIEFLNAKGLGCKISLSFVVCPKEIESGFSGVLSAEYLLYVNGLGAHQTPKAWKTES